MDPKIPNKFSHDSGLGHELLDSPPKKQVSTAQKGIKGRGFISKLSRDQHHAAAASND